ncbi:Long-chain-fatty-acid--CoA ligase [Aquicella siphonis]|uniref:Long-chain-fatty-acid--CoA ligase n=1 Tax=Aquicella siphonis TaxID=254247 RepID=A0A5E4PJW6_9COXI|nr:acyl-CoA synthetase [Aquicella siphonis]VVC76612.1 Long-chain-fatty-acid--CoA ligase [Aquicella siphonis]
MDIQSGKITSLVDVERMETTPVSAHHLAPHTYAIFEQSARQFGNKTALRFLYTGKPEEIPVNYSYQELFSRITQTANALHDLGVTRTDTVSLLMPNLPQHHFALWGAQAAGIANPINPMLAAEHIRQIMKKGQTKVLITLSGHQNSALWEKVQKIVPDVHSLQHILTVNPEQFAVPRAQLQTALSGISHIHRDDFDDLISRYPGARLDFEQAVRSDMTACYFHTGGTTGSPKLAIQSHFNQVFSAWMVGRQLQWDSSDVMHCGLPLFHVNAPLISGLAPFTVGGEVLLTSPHGFRSEAVIANFWKWVEQYRISFFMAVPTVYLALNKTWSPEINTSSLKFAACGAAPMPTALIKEFESRTGISILEGYGLTEGTVFSSVNPPFGKRKTGSIGIRIPYQNMKAVCLDENQRYLRDCEPDEIGALAVKGPNVFQGYLGEENSHELWIADGWLNTGDLGRQDEEGYFWLTGRSKDLIIRGGHNIDPRVIEEALNKHPAVAMAAAVGKPDGRMGEIPAAYVTLHTGMTATSSELEKFAARHITEHVATPKAIYIISDMPLTAVGKIYKPALRLDIVKRAVEERLLSLASTGAHITVDVKPHTASGLLTTVRLSGSETASCLIPEIEKILAAFKMEFIIQPQPRPGYPAADPPS